jgi:hypothetical protein
MTNAAVPDSSGLSGLSGLSDLSGLPVLPTPIFQNASQLDALFFNTLDQYASGFHVVVAKTAYQIGPCAADGFASLKTLELPHPAALLATEDAHFEDNLRHSPRWESDLTPYKPACDVIVIADAHAPGARAVPQFSSQLRVQGPMQGRGIEHSSKAGQIGGAGYAEPPAHPGQAAPLPFSGEVLINKHLHLFGPRQFVWQNRAWQLTQPQPVARVPLRYEYAAGGACMVTPADAFAAQVPAAERLPAPDPETSAIAWQVAETNPLGAGFVRHWYWQASGLNQFPAPQIGYPQAPYDVAAFERTLNGAAMPEPAGFGAIGRAWLPRRQRVGQVDSQTDWASDDVPMLPLNFDFGYWNASPLDQQCRHLQGGEQIRLINLCPPEHPASHADAHGNQIIDLALPEQACILLIGVKGAQADTQLRIENLLIDTVLIDVLEGTLSLTWRISLPVDTSITTLRLLHATEPAQLARLAELQAMSEMSNATGNTSGNNATGAGN